MGVNSKCGFKARESTKAMTLAFALLDFQQVGVRRRVVYKMECRHLTVQKGKQDQNHSQHSLLIWGLISSDVGLTYLGQ